MGKMSDNCAKSFRDDRSSVDSHSIGSIDEGLLDEIKNDKFCKQKRRGSGLGGIANYFKANIAKGRPGHGRNSKEKDNSSRADGVSEDSSRGSDKEHKSPASSDRSPQEFLDVMLRSRGYSRALYCTLDTAYYNDPSPLQLASYHARVEEFARENKIDDIRALFATGMSNNPCNEKGDSLMHEICRLGFKDILVVMVEEFGADVRISNDSGKTPLHVACVGGRDGPFFSLVDILASKDRRMFSLKDASDRTPLSYIPVEHWGAWIDYLYIRRDTYWPRRLVRAEGEEPPPPLTEENPKSRVVPDPRRALTIDLAAVLVAGDMSPERVAECRRKSGGSEESTDDTATEDSNSSNDS